MNGKHDNLEQNVNDHRISILINIFIVSYVLTKSATLGESKFDVFQLQSDILKLQKKR